MTDKEKIESLQAYLNITWREFARRVGLSTTQTFTDIRNGKHGISMKLGNRIVKEFPGVRIEWLMFGMGEMTHERQNRGLPILENTTADNTTTDRDSDRIDINDYFRGATRILRNADAGMKEYPAGAMLVLKEIEKSSPLVPGTIYVFETKDFTLARRFQRSSEESFSLYSTNDEKYPDGRMVFEPFTIPESSVLHIYSILGYMVKNSSDVTPY